MKPVGVVGLLLGAFLLTGAAPAEEGVSEVQSRFQCELVEPLHWVGRPATRDFIRVYPRDAAYKRQDGRTTLSCTVGQNGEIQDCVITDETPKNQGFGTAALKLTPMFELTPPRCRNGQAASGGMVIIPMRWSISDDSASIVPPHWLRTPTVADVLRVYPRRARRERVGGHATMHCWVTTQGALNRCTVTEETPTGYQFGEALLSLADAFRLAPRTVDGRPVEGAEVTIPVTFHAN